MADAPDTKVVEKQHDKAVPIAKLTAGLATSAKIGKGTTLAFGIGTTTPAVLAEVLSIKMPKHVTSTIEIQRYDSPTVFGELIPSWAKGGDIEATITYETTQAVSLFAAFGLAGSWVITKPDSHTWTFKGVMTEYGESVPLKDKMSIDVKFAISGVPTAG